MVTGQLRLRVKQIHLARPTVHKQVDHRLGLRLKVGPTRFEIEHLSRCSSLRNYSLGTVQVPAHQRQ